MKSTIRALVVGLWPVVTLADPLALSVLALAETQGTSGDADDPAIWADPALPLILGTDKEAGLFVYGLDGAVRQFLPDGRLNNVDVRPFALNGRALGLAAATRRDGTGDLVFYILADGLVRPADPMAHAAVPGWMTAEVRNIYGFALGQDAGGTYAIVNFKSGHVLQYRVTERAGRIALTLARHFRVGSQPEGMVADDQAGHLYLGEEDVGLWRLPLAPEDPATLTAIDTIPSPCLPRDDVEGLAVVDGGSARWLVASAQGVHRAAIYRLAGEATPTCAALVEIAPGAIDGVTETDGLDVTGADLGPGFGGGLLVMMDDQNAGFTTNFKLIPWGPIAAALPE